MVKAFNFSRLPDLFFGNGKLNLLPEIIRKFGTNIILVSGKSSFMNSPEAEKLLCVFEESGIKHHHVIIADEPSPEMIDGAVAEHKDKTIDIVVAIGGGSVLDAGKAISAMMYLTDSVKDYLEGVGSKQHPGTKLPFVAVPTTSGTGSESTKNAVISQIGVNGFKKSLRHDNFVPDIAVVDPGLTLHCPEEITATSGMDCFTQLVEAFLSDKSCEYTDALALEGVGVVKKSLLRSYINGTDPEARIGMSFAALTSGICLANAGLGIIHGFASSIGGMYPVPHGLLCGTLMAPANAINIRELRKSSGNSYALNKYVRLGKIFLDEKGKSDDFYIDGFIDYLYHLTDNFRFKKLSEYGLKEKDVPLICSVTDNKNNPVRLDDEAKAEILIQRL